MTSDPAGYLGRAIAAARSELGFKRMQLKERSGLSYPYIAEIENGGKYPSQRAIAALAEALETKPSELLARAERLAAADQGQGWAEDRAAHAFSMLGPAAGSVVGGALASGPHSADRDEQLVSRLTDQVMKTVEPRLKDWLQVEIRMAVQEELQRQREAR